MNTEEDEIKQIFQSWEKEYISIIAESIFLAGYLRGKEDALREVLKDRDYEI